MRWTPKYVEHGKFQANVGSRDLLCFVIERTMQHTHTSRLSDVASALVIEQILSV
jgi:hypothetical protein